MIGLVLMTVDDLQPLDYNAETRKYIRAYAYNYRWDHSTGSDTSSEKLEMKPCEDKDFNRTDVNVKVFE